MKCLQSGVCCRLFLINLNEKEYLSGQFHTVFEEFGLMKFSEAELAGANFLKQKADGSCIYLENNKCTTHKNRPQVCREFFCDSKEDKFQGMIQEIKLKRKDFILPSES